MENNKKQDKVDNYMENGGGLNKKRVALNAVNSFLNSYFQYFSFIILFFVFWFSFNFILSPRYEKVSLASAEVLEARKSVFIKEYKELNSYKKNIEVFENIRQEDIEKIKKMIPGEYSKDELFTEFAYLLMKNNFNLKSLKINNPANLSSNKSQPSRRAIDIDSPVLVSQAERVYSALPSEIGSWLIKAEVTGVDYFALKYLLDVIENNLKLIDIVNIKFDPTNKIVSFDALTYYLKNNYE